MTSSSTNLVAAIDADSLGKRFSNENFTFTSRGADGNADKNVALVGSTNARRGLLSF